jgi:hypothetical protein
MEQVIKIYFGGEKQESLILLLTGLVLAGLCLGIHQTPSQHQLAKGLLWPLCLLAAIGILAGGYTYYQNGQRLEQYPNQYRQAPAQFLDRETDRMQRVNAWWLPLKIFWSLLVLSGTGLVLFPATAYRTGLGLGLLLLGTAGLLVDSFAQARAVIYSQSLSRQLPKLGKP